MRERGVGGREVGEARRRGIPADHEAESCYITGESRAEENRAQISEICCTDARTSRIPSKKILVQTGHILTWTYSKVDMFHCIQLYRVYI